MLVQCVAALLSAPRPRWKGRLGGGQALFDFGQVEEFKLQGSTDPTCVLLRGRPNLSLRTVQSCSGPHLGPTDKRWHIAPLRDAHIFEVY